MMRTISELKIAPNRGGRRRRPSLLEEAPKTVEQVMSWLERNDFGQYAEAFRENKITGDILLYLDRADLLAIGVKAVGDRIKLLRLCENLDAPTRAEHVIVPVELLLNFKSISDTNSGGVISTVTIVQRRFHDDYDMVQPFEYRIADKTLRNVNVDRQGPITKDEGTHIKGCYSISRIDVACDLQHTFQNWPFELCELQLEIGLNSYTKKVGHKHVTFRPSIVIWRQGGINLSLKTHHIIDRSERIDLLFCPVPAAEQNLRRARSSIARYPRARTPSFGTIFGGTATAKDMAGKWPPKVTIKQEKRFRVFYYPALQVSFLACMDWQERVITIFFPLLFCIIGSGANYYHFFESEMSIEQGTADYLQYFENQLALALIVVFIVKEMRVRKVTNELERSDGFVAVIIVGLMLSLSYTGWVCGMGQSILLLSLLIPALNYYAFVLQQRKWKDEVETSLVMMKTPSREDVSKLGNSLFDITQPEGKVTPFVRKGRNFESVHVKRTIASSVKKELFGGDSTDDGISRDTYVDECDGENPMHPHSSSSSSSSCDAAQLAEARLAHLRSANNERLNEQTIQEVEEEGESEDEGDAAGASRS
jgi:hypothetical protein